MTQKYNEYKLSARKDVNNLVKEFEMKKSADSYSRSATARTGMLDMNSYTHTSITRTSSRRLQSYQRARIMV